MSCIYARGLPGAEVLVRQEQLIRLKRDRGNLLEDTADILSSSSSSAKSRFFSLSVNSMP